VARTRKGSYFFMYGVHTKKHTKMEIIQAVILSRSVCLVISLLAKGKVVPVLN
jgi:hypothetical protein